MISPSRNLRQAKGSREGGLAPMVAECPTQVIRVRPANSSSSRGTGSLLQFAGFYPGEGRATTQQAITLLNVPIL